MSDAPSFSHPAGEPIDLRHLDATLANLRRSERDVAGLVVFVAEARDRLAAAPDDAEARHALRMGVLRMRGAATALAYQFAALADGPSP